MATDAYRQEMDPLYDFGQYVTIDPAASTSSADIRKALEAWARDEGIKTLPTYNELATWLSGLGCTAERAHGARGWRGLRVDGADSLQSFGGESVTP
ncbi:MAG TPA: hypothetical protein VJ787_05065 [Thermoleophilia bacterium]|nr:hypothetical protein [Thermoleophilia bacterium]